MFRETAEKRERHYKIRVGRQYLNIWGRIGGTTFHRKYFYSQRYKNEKILRGIKLYSNLKYMDNIILPLIAPEYK